MSLPSTSRGTEFVADGSNVNGNGGRLGHRQGNLSRTSLLPSDSISVSGGMAGSRSTASKVPFKQGNILTAAASGTKGLKR
jgi:hypothetical protein